MSWHLALLGIIFIIAGIAHCIKPKAFMRIMPLYIPYHKIFVYISGIVEIASGIGLFFESVRMYALLSIILMLVLFFPVHIHMLLNKKAGLNLPKSILVFRLMLQFGFIYWVYQYV